MHDRAYALLDVKSFDAETRIIEGFATTPAPDRGGDVMDPGGAVFTLPMPLLWQHNQAQPVGEVIEARVTPDGILIKARLARVTDPGPLQERLDDAWQHIKAGLVRGLSIGWKAITASARKGGGHHVSKWHWAELSLVTIPLNQTATILSIKSAALGPNPSSVVDPHPVVRIRNARPMKKTFAEQRAEYEAARATKATHLVDLMNGVEDGATLEAKAQEDYDTTALEIKSLDAHIARLKECEALNIVAAAPLLTKAPTLVTQGGVPYVQVKQVRVEPGTAFVRSCMAMFRAKGDSMRALEYAKQWKDSTPEVELMIKAAVAPGTTTDPAWAAALVQVRNATEEFLALLRPATIIGKIPNLRHVPFNTLVPVQTAGGSYGWVGQGAPKPVTKLAIGTAALGIAKAAGIIVITEELAKLSSPSAETIVRGDMIAGITQFLDEQFINPAVAEVANVNPASITNGAPTAASSDSAMTDLAMILAHFTANNGGLAGITFIMSENNALAMGMLQNATGGKVFPAMSATGGAAEGFTVVASNAAGTNVIGVKGDQILYADDGGIAIDVSREASVLMDSAPPAAPDATAVYTSLWQNNLVGLRAERMVNWKRGRSSAVYYLTDAVYPAVPPPAGTLGAPGNGGAVRGGRGRGETPDQTPNRPNA
jgi:HK97 family phage prohead protease/HK97 family phage major capsid protein